jgi:hypothetical protein
MSARTTRPFGAAKPFVLAALCLWAFVPEVVSPARAEVLSNVAKKRAEIAQTYARNARAREVPTSPTPDNGVLAGASPQSRTFTRPETAVRTQRNCGQTQCVSFWNELTAPHDATYQGRLKAQKAYNDCMARCEAAPGMRR